MGSRLIASVLDDRSQHWTAGRPDAVVLRVPYLR